MVDRREQLGRQPEINSRAGEVSSFIHALDGLLRDMTARLADADAQIRTDRFFQSGYVRPRAVAKTAMNSHDTQFSAATEARATGNDAYPGLLRTTEHPPLEPNLDDHAAPVSGVLADKPLASTAPLDIEAIRAQLMRIRGMDN